MNILEVFILVVTIILTWQLMYFFVVREGRFQKWRLRKSIETIHRYIKNNTHNGSLPVALTFTYRKKSFDVGIIEERLNSSYKYYQLFINGEGVAKYHCLMHDVLISHYLESTAKRNLNEVIQIINAGRKYLDRLDRERYKVLAAEQEEKSFF